MSAQNRITSSIEVKRVLDLSVSVIVIADASTGKNKTSRVLVTVDQINKGFFTRICNGLFILYTLMMRFNCAIIGFTHIGCSEKIVKATVGSQIN